MSENDLLKNQMRIQSLMEAIFDSLDIEWKECPICKNKMRVFEPAGTIMRPNVECRYCHSYERHRQLWLYLKKYKLLERGQKVLHFAPEEAFFAKLSEVLQDDYYPVDIDPNQALARYTVDITDIQFENDFFDLIICNHVLEHVTELGRALSEVKRVLKPSGLAILNVPLRRSMEKTMENPEYNTPELRKKYYGQEDHVRLFGRDYPDILRGAGFEVNICNPEDLCNVDEMRRYWVGKAAIYACHKII